ncbi:MAG: Arm DNA-binding domain-containing protein [Candidatus Macondimonas sp.]
MSILQTRFKFTNIKVKALPAPTDKDQVFYWDTETQGLGLRITAAGAKSYFVRGRVNGSGKDRRFTLVSAELLSCDEARKRAQVKRLEMLDGLDPQVEKKKVAPQSETLREVMEDYIEHKRTKNWPLRPSARLTFGAVWKAPSPTGRTNLWSASVGMLASSLPQPSRLAELGAREKCDRRWCLSDLAYQSRVADV